MRSPLTLLLALTLAAPLTAETEVTRFPVFGPSEERAAFFAAQEAARQQAYRDLQAERAERLRAKTEADAARKPGREIPYYQPRAGGLTRELICTDPTPAPQPRPTRTTPGRAELGAAVRVRPAPQEPVCRVVYTRVPVYPAYPRVYDPYPGGDTKVIIGVGKDGVSGRLIHRRPGLTLDITKD